MKVLFLDIDGVVNCATTPQRFNGFFGIDPYMALMIDRIIQATGCQVVLSSSWRHHEDSMEEVRKRVCKFIDVTPTIYPGIRGDEIKAWLDRHDSVFENEPVTKYAIVDDNSDMLDEQMPNFFKTMWPTGITQEVANEIIAHLNAV
jgi:hypothetical protein